MEQIKEASIRALQIIGTKEKVARFLNAEFNMSVYVSKGKVWAQYRKESGEYATAVVMN